MAEELGCVDFLGEDDLFLDFDLSLFTETPIAGDFIRSSPDSANSWIGDIESQLMNDEDNQNFLELDQQSVSEFLADIFVDDPTSDSADLVTGKVDDVPTEGFVNGKGPEESNDAGKEKAVEKKWNGSENLDEAKVESEISGDDDAMAKKRRRRVRNRDAAVRSRERKKEYVTDLEKKSKYLERECMRLGRMLDCFVAENHSLRLCLQKGGGNASMMTRQESAVLLLESLLLGSLLWYLGDIICPFLPHPQPKTCFLPAEADGPEKLVLSGRESSKLSNNYACKSRRCKGSRPRMKHQVCILVA
ncbi:PREDICTED: bZIP transcription factor 60 [Brassica oleracea var. oleracea]|uniref:BZIP domain-containing protein n=1 Tax=Brassica oleracea var. oleracea TaxID=109376 RepID=A0A0D3DKD7_BRAOL|nr:PREDICTED: bZIP transcription factor 60 [Brassica oleracea var. oleracea]